MTDDSRDAAKSYLEKHNLEHIFKDLMSTLLHHKPEYPLRFLVEALSLIEQKDLAGENPNYTDILNELATSRSGVKRSISPHLSSTSRKGSKISLGDMEVDSPGSQEENDSVCDSLSSATSGLSTRFQKVDTGIIYNRGRRGSVSAESIRPTEDTSAKVVNPKSDEARVRIATATCHNLLFRNLESEQRREIVDAMFEKRIEKGEVVIRQGDEGDNFYVVDEGAFDVLVKKNGEEKKVITITPGGSFGELALMYNTPRAATVVATTDGVLWAVDRATFRRSLTNHSFRKRRMYENFLRSVPLLSSLERNEVVKVADALEPIEYEDGDVIVEQGAPGEYFYMIESGDCAVTKTDSKGEEHEMIGLTAGQYFGELALLNDTTRSATVTAKGKVKVAALSRDAFVRLLGPVMDILKRHTDIYRNLVMA